MANLLLFHELKKLAFICLTKRENSANIFIYKERFLLIKFLEDIKVETLETNLAAPVVGAEATASNQQAVETQPLVQTNKAARFKEKAEAQASKVIAELEKLQKLSNRKYYSYSSEQVDELFNALYIEMSDIKQHFTTDAVEKKKLFTFSA